MATGSGRIKKKHNNERENTCTLKPSIWHTASVFSCLWQHPASIHHWLLSYLEFKTGDIQECLEGIEFPKLHPRTAGMGWGRQWNDRGAARVRRDMQILLQPGREQKRQTCRGEHNFACTNCQSGNYLWHEMKMLLRQVLCAMLQRCAFFTVVNNVTFPALCGYRQERCYQVSSYVEKDVFLCTLFVWRWICSQTSSTRWIRPTDQWEVCYDNCQTHFTHKSIMDLIRTIQCTQSHHNQTELREHHGLFHWFSLIHLIVFLSSNFIPS